MFLKDNTRKNILIGQINCLNDKIRMLTRFELPYSSLHELVSLQKQVELFKRELKYC